jgi:putative endonuclease
MARERWPAVYMVASGRGGTLYVGVTSDLVRRVGEHRAGAGAGFAARYGCRMLVWFEPHAGMEAAIRREKQIKGWLRARKIALILEGNPLWEDLWPRILGEGEG